MLNLHRVGVPQRGRGRNPALLSQSGARDPRPQKKEARLYDYNKQAFLAFSSMALNRSSLETAALTSINRPMTSFSLHARSGQECTPARSSRLLWRAARGTVPPVSEKFGNKIVLRTG
jgi:hypothetical protein